MPPSSAYKTYSNLNNTTSLSRAANSAPINQQNLNQFYQTLNSRPNSSHYNHGGANGSGYHDKNISVKNFHHGGPPIQVSVY